jgi:lipopolysaccharide biosynthesis glycosyltransferase
MLNIWIGYDSQFEPNRLVQEQSIKTHTSIPFTLNYLKLDKLSHILYRPRSEFQSTDSAFTRWLVPHLSNFEGWSLYMDSDMMLRRDLKELIDLADHNKAVMVVQHPLYHIGGNKFNNKKQSQYERKNWSSLILFNNSKCDKLTLDYINTASGLDLHQFKWLSDDLIGNLPLEWNHLVGYNKPNKNAAIVHWTIGGPWFEQYQDCEYSFEWASLNACSNSSL